MACSAHLPTVDGLCWVGLASRFVFGLGTGSEVLAFLEEYAHGGPPPNVLYTVKQWTEDVEVVRQQKVLLLRSHSSGGADRLERILDEREVPHERLNDTTVMVRGGKNERRVKDLLEHFRDHGLHVE